MVIIRDSVYKGPPQDQVLSTGTFIYPRGTKGREYETKTGEPRMRAKGKGTGEMWRDIVLGAWMGKGLLPGREETNDSLER